MSEMHMLISDAARNVDVPAHVLRYWEEELELEIPRNEMGHRYYTEVQIRLFRQVKELKEKGYQLKAIKMAMDRSIKEEQELVVKMEILEEDVVAVLKECLASDVERTEPTEELDKLDNREITARMTQEKAEQFRQMMVQMIGQAIEENNEKLSQDISKMVNDRVVKELDYLMRVADERDEERFRQLDETIRYYQRENKGKAEAAATVAKIPFLTFAWKNKKGKNCLKK